MVLLVGLKQKNIQKFYFFKIFWSKSRNCNSEFKIRNESQKPKKVLFWFFLNKSLNLIPNCSFVNDLSFEEKQISFDNRFFTEITMVVIILKLSNFVTGGNWFVRVKKFLLFLDRFFVPGPSLSDSVFGRSDVFVLYNPIRKSQQVFNEKSKSGMLHYDQNVLLRGKIRMRQKFRLWKRGRKIVFTLLS